MARVTLMDPESMNLLGHFLVDLLERNLARPSRRFWLLPLRASILIQASGMKVTLKFDRGAVCIFRGEEGPPRAAVRGTLAALVDVVTWTNPVGPLWRGEVRVSGRIWLVALALPALLCSREG